MRHLIILTTLAIFTMPLAARADDAVTPILLPPAATGAESAAASQSVAQADPQTVQVPVLKQPVQKGETIMAENITMQSIPASQSFASTIGSADELVGQQAIRPIPASQPVNRMHVRIAPQVSRNQAVTFVYRRGGVELTGHGQALEDGAVGQSIRVINPATRSTIVGTIAAGGLVEIN